MKNSFVLYTSYKEHIDLLSVEEKAQLLDAIFQYAEGYPEEQIIISGMAKMAFSFIRQQMDKDNEKYDEICRKRKEAGKKGAAAKQANGSNCLDEQTNNSICKQVVANASKCSGKEAKDSNANQSQASETSDSLSYSLSYSLIIKNVINYLNDKAHKKFRSSSKSTKEMIIARLNEGYSEEDFYRVIDNKVEDWLGDSKMEQYLAPDTLFRPSHFERYLNQKSEEISDTPFEVQPAADDEDSEWENLSDEEWVAKMESLDKEDTNV